MKFTEQRKDGVIDNLLRAYVSRPGNPGQACPEFDPDRANAYIERSLTSAQRSQYERHLSTCGECRKSVVALFRLAQTDLSASTYRALEVSRPSWFSGIKQAFSAMWQPRWALAATAVIVLAIGLPLVLSRTWSKQTSAPAVATEVASARQESQEPQAQNAPAAMLARRSAEADRSAGVVPAARPTASGSSPEKSVISATDSLLAAKAAQVAPGTAGEEFKKQNVKASGPPADETKSKAESQAAQNAAPAGAASQVAKSDSDQFRQQQSQKDANQQAANQVNEPRSTRADQESAEREKGRRNEEAAAVVPAPPPSSESRDRAKLLRPAPKLALRDSGAAVDAVRVEERKISGKKFLFRDGAWTDKDFDPNKDLPIVTVIRDSNVYKELLAKRSGLRSIMDRFSSSERAIIVYKGTVYKLIPQQGDK